VRGSVRALCLIAIVLRAGAAAGACPSDPCDCLGEAKNFTLIGSKLVVVQEGRQTAYNYDYLVGSFVIGGVCTPRLVASGPVGLPTHFTAGYAVNGPGRIAASFAQRIPPGYEADYGVSTLYLSTGGGSIKGLRHAAELIVDTTGTDPGIASCRQAMLDVESASATLAGLVPTHDFGKVLLKGTDLEIEAGPGVNVVTTERIYVLPRKEDGFLEPGRIFVTTVPETEAVIINTSGLWIGEVSGIFIQDPVRVIVNVVGPGPTVKIGRDGFSEAPILAPERSVSVGVVDPELSAGPIMARRVRLKGGTAYDNFSACP
jgi:hypothetical protein